MRLPDRDPGVMARTSGAAILRRGQCIVNGAIVLKASVTENYGQCLKTGKPFTASTNHLQDMV
jgi:hypothetical protein